MWMETGKEGKKGRRILNMRCLLNIPAYAKKATGLLGQLGSSDIQDLVEQWVLNRKAEQKYDDGE